MITHLHDLGVRCPRTALVKTYFSITEALAGAAYQMSLDHTNLLGVRCPRTALVKRPRLLGKKAKPTRTLNSHRRSSNDPS
jgi:hypothetical protein